MVLFVLAVNKVLFIFNRKAHTVKQDAVQSFCIG